MDIDQSGSLTAIVYIFYSSKTRITPRMFSWVTSTSVNYIGKIATLSPS